MAALALAGCGGAYRPTPAFGDEIFVGGVGIGGTNYLQSLGVYKQGDTFIVTNASEGVYAVNSYGYSPDVRFAKVEVFDGETKLGEAQVASSTDPSYTGPTVWRFPLGLTSKDSGRLLQVQARGTTADGVAARSKVARVRVAIQWPQYLFSSNFYSAGGFAAPFAQALNAQGNLVYPVSVSDSVGGSRVGFVQTDSDANSKTLEQLSPQLPVIDTLALDSRNNIYAAGGFFGGPGNLPAFIAKFDGRGQRQWLKALEGVSPGSDNAAAKLVVASDSSIWLMHPNRSLIRFDASGNEQERISLTVLDGAQGGRSAVITPSSGGVILAYVFNSSIVLRRFNPNGSLNWTQSTLITRTNGGNADLVSLTTDSGGGIYVAGRVLGGLGSNPNRERYEIFAAKFDSSGTLAWASQFGESGGEVVRDGVLDANNNFYLQGAVAVDFQGQKNIGEQDVWVAKFGPTGAREWIKLFGTDRADLAAGLAVLPTGNVLLISFSNGFVDARPSTPLASNSKYVIDQITPAGERTYRPPTP